MSQVYPSIAIIDSGVDSSILQIDYHISGISVIKNAQGELLTSNDFCDEIGHGSGIYGIIRKHNHNAEIFIVKVCNRENPYPDIETLNFALNYILEKTSCNLVNISMGISLSDEMSDIHELEYLCRRFYDSKRIIVASFDNTGSMSYPAAFKTVIGVTSGTECLKNTDIEYVENSQVNLCGKGNNQNTLSIDSKYMLSNGNSLACANICGLLSNIIMPDSSFESLLETMKKRAIRKHSFASEPRRIKNPVKYYKKAALFPFNKEMHNIVRYRKQLSFDIVDIYDIKYSGQVGSSVNELLHLDGDENDNYYIKNILDIDYDSFDTLILGHTDKICMISKVQSIVTQIIQECIVRGKFVYSFDNNEQLRIQDNDLIFSPSKYNNFIYAPFGKLYRIPKPVVGVFGTSSSQGKFSLQLALRDFFISRGYSVGQIGSEPTALLFGTDDCFHFGYNSTCSITRYDTIAYINNSMHRISQKDVDIILTGCQSRTLPIDIGNLNGFNLPQYEFLVASQPDLILLCVNPWDDEDYIFRTISFIESAVLCKVIALVVYPYNLINDGDNYMHVMLNEEMYDTIKLRFEKNYSLPVYRLDSPSNMLDLGKLIIDYL